MVVRVVADQMAVVCDPAHRRGRRLRPAALDEERGGHMRRVERREDPIDRPGARAGTIRMLGVERERDPGPVAPSLTDGDLRCPEGGPRLPPPNDGETMCEQLRRHDRRRGSDRPSERADPDVRRLDGPGAVDGSSPRVITHTAEPASRSSRARPLSSASVSGSVAITIAASVGPASSTGPWRNCAASSASAGRPTASLSVRAAISAAARAGPRPRTTISSRGPSHARRSIAERRVREEAFDRDSGAIRLS